MIPKLESLGVAPVIPVLLLTINGYLEKSTQVYDDTMIFRIPNVDFSKLTAESATKVSIECLGAIARQANDSTIRHVLKPIWDFLDDQNRWVSKPELVRSIMRIIVQSSNEWSSKGYVIVSANMQHFEEILDRAQKAGMIRANIFIISIQSKKGATSGARAFEAVAQLINTLKSNFVSSTPKISPTQYEEILKTDALTSSVLECLNIIAQRGKFTQQNVSLMDSIQQLIRQQEGKITVSDFTRNVQGLIESEQLSPNIIQHLLLVDCLLNVAKIGAYILSQNTSNSSNTNQSNTGNVPAGSSGNNNAQSNNNEFFFPSHLVNALLESSVKPNSSVYVRVKYLNVFLAMLSTKEPYLPEQSPNIGTSDKKPAMSPAIIEDIDASNSAAIKTRITISKSQRAKIYVYIYKGLFLNDNLPENFAAIARILRNMLKHYRNKEIENALPMLFKLQEAAVQTASSTTSTGSSNTASAANDEEPTPLETVEKQQTMHVRHKLMIHTLIVTYLLCLAELYNSKELEQYIKSIMDTRIQQGLLTKTVLSTFEKRHNSGNSIEAMKAQASEEEKLKEYTQSFASLIAISDKAAASIDKIELVSQDKVCELLCKIETLKETYGDVAGVTKVVKKAFTGDSITKTTTVVVTDEENTKPIDDPWYGHATDEKSAQVVQVIEGLDIDQLANKTKNVSRDSLQINQVQLDLSTSLAGSLSKRREEKSKILDSILDAVPSDLYDSDDEELEEIEQQPRLFLFDSAQFINV